MHETRSEIVQRKLPPQTWDRVDKLSIYHSSHRPRGFLLQGIFGHQTKASAHTMAGGSLGGLSSRQKHLESLGLRSCVCVCGGIPAFENWFRQESLPKVWTDCNHASRRRFPDGFVFHKPLLHIEVVVSIC